MHIIYILNDAYKDIYPPELQLKVEYFNLLKVRYNIKRWKCSFINFLIRVMLVIFLLFACLTMMVTSPSQYFSLLLL